MFTSLLQSGTESFFSSINGSGESLHHLLNMLLWGESEVEGYKLLLTDLLIFLAVVIVAFVVYFFVKRIVLNLVRKLAGHTKTKWDDEFLKGRLLVWVSLIVPVLIIWKVGGHAFSEEQYKKALEVFGEVSIIVLIFGAINSVLNAGERIYRRYEVSKKFPVKGFIQVVKIVLTVCAVIFTISSLIGKSPLSLFAGLGAMSAVLMFIFKDSILGLVAGIQLSANQMVARGDWIEVPKFGADGEVLEVALTTVKVRNWDMTITTLPTYALISDSFKNWRGMSQSGVRRIKRAVKLDLQSVKFVDEKLLKRLESFKLLDDYLGHKKKELEEWNTSEGVEASDVRNARVLTNVGTFRAYVLAYLKNHKMISQSHTILVRQLQPNEYGLPIEVYVFCTDNRWVEFEAVQSDIFDHFLAVVEEFELCVYQRTSGNDFAQHDKDLDHN